LRREFNGFVKRLEHVSLKNHRDSLGRFRLAAEIQWLCQKSLEHGVLENHRDSLWRFHLTAEIQWLCEES
jgi:phage terminase Nu1 subunit (DNA packaging protein)